jgi:Transglycosylase
MTSRPSRRLLLVLLALLAVAALALGFGRELVRSALAGRLHRAAGARGLVADWRVLSLEPPFRVRLLGLTLARAGGDTLFRAESLLVTAEPWSVVALHPKISRLELEHAQVQWRSAPPADTLAPEEAEPLPATSARLERLRDGAEKMTQLLLAPARRLPRLTLRDVTLMGPAGEDAVASGARLSLLDLDRDPHGVRLRASGALAMEHTIPFQVSLTYGNDDRLSGDLVLDIPDSTGGAETLRIAVAGALAQNRRTGVLRLADTTRVTFGRLPLTLGGSLDRHGPRLRFALSADSLTGPRIVASLPRAVLGPLLDLAIRGSFDYRLHLDLDLASPDSVDFAADVVPHDLALDPRATRLPIFGLDGPFVAAIHLPHDRIVHRDLSPANPFYRPLEGIDSLLVHAVITNEDGGFYRHHGFNVEAIKSATAENLKAGAYRRGAGTITMQIARNLFLGHRRTLSRKAQEVVLAWVLEHLTGLSKHRLLEIYLNIIEWGPEVHGAAEAAHFYFGRDPATLSASEALFLTTVIPAPARWRGRLDADGNLKRFEREQMHFIGRAMAAKGWLDPALLPPTDSLRVELRGPAHDVMFPPVAAPADSGIVI